MAEGNSGAPQRAFAKNIKGQSAAQIRQSTTATVKAMAEQQTRPRLRVVDPLDYEGELSSRRRDLEKEQYLNLLLFPQQDIVVDLEDWDRRTQVGSVPEQALQLKSTLFTSECLKFYTSQWHRVQYNYSKFSCSFSKVINPEYRKGLSPETFELDLIEEERLVSLASSDFTDGGTPLSKKGSLLKGPFPADGGITVSTKNYKKRWGYIRGGPSEGGYTLCLYKDEKSSNLKGKVPLDTCTEIKKNTRHKPFGFDLLTEDEKVFYPMAAESEAEMEEWISLLTRAMAMEVEESDRVPASPTSFYQQETLRETKAMEMRPELLQYTSTTDATNIKNREKDRHPLFHVYPGLMQTSATVDDQKPHAPLPMEKFGLQFLVQCHNLQFRLTSPRDGRPKHLEPFYLTMALFDAQKAVKISEDFHVDLNDPTLRQMVTSPPGFRKGGPHPLSQQATNATEGIFSVTFPHPDVYLVVRIEKVLQGGITACAEPYMKTGENTKIAQKLAQQMGAVCNRLGQYRMPFAWAVRPLFTAMEELDPSAEFSHLFKQEREKLTDEEIIKVLADFKNLHKHKMQVIPGSLHIEVVLLQDNISKTILTPSLLPLKGSTANGDISEASPSPTTPSRTISSRPPPPRPPTPILEVQEFPPFGAYHPHSHYHPYLSLTHHLYVYPAFLKYDAQKTFAKARNIACCVTFMDSDDKDAQPMAVIYSKSAGTKIFTDRANSAVLHHCSTPWFYEEVKVKLPIQLKRSHHLLFTFYHISCDVQRAAKSSKGSTKLPPVEAVVGYAWLPLVDSEGSVIDDSHSLAVAANLPPGYLGLAPQSAAMADRRSGTPEHIKWVDGRKPIFRVSTRLDSTIYTQNPELNGFFSICQKLAENIALPQTQLNAALKSLTELSQAPTIQFLPVILTQLFKLLSHSSKDIEPLKPNMLLLLLKLVDKVVNVDRTELLRTYIEYIFVTEVDSSRKRAVHDELARLLVQYLRQQNGELIRKLLDHLWFFFEVMLKSMAQYLTITKKITSSRKNRYPEDFGWNLQSFVTVLLTHIRERHSDISAKRANRSLADFIRRTFSFMDRGVVFKIVARYLEAFCVRENMQLSQLKLEFLRIICDHEHYIPLNLLFPLKPEEIEYSLNDEFCRKHFLAGVLLREVESSLDYEAGPIRTKTIRILRNLLAKHDCDPRYIEAGQRARIAALYFPLIPLVLEHVTRLSTGTTPYISPMLNATSMASFQAREAKILASSAATPEGTLEKNKDKDKVSLSGFSSSELASVIASHHKTPRGTLSASGAPNLPRIDDESLLDPETSITSESTTMLIPSSPLDQTILEMDKLTVEETRDLMVCVLFVLKHVDNAVLLHWWQECMGTSPGAPRWSSYEDVFSAQFSLLLDFFDLLESCLYAFKYTGRRNVAVKLSTQSSMPRETAPDTPTYQQTKEKEKANKKHSIASFSSVSGTGGAPGKSKPVSRTSSNSAMSPSTPTPIIIPAPLPPSTTEEVNLHTKVEGALTNEVGLIILTTMDTFAANFNKEVCQEEGDNILMVKYFSLLMTFLQVNQSVTFQTHLFASLRAYVYKFKETLFKGSAEYCGILCYEILQCCNSRIPETRMQAISLLYLMMRCNFEYFSGHGFVRTHLQSMIAVSKLVSSLLGKSDSNLRRSLAAIAAYAGQDEKVQATPFPAEVKDLMKRLKTVLSTTAQMKAHHNDPEKLVDLHYSLAKSYANSPELRQTWLDSMAALHLKYGNYSEAAHCCVHIASLVAEYLKIKGRYPSGCVAFRNVSPNVELEESGIKEDHETSDEQRYTERNLVSLLESSINYLEQAERYEMMSEVFKLLQPFYERARDFKHMMEMYGKLHGAYRKVVDIMATGRRYLATYFRIAFYGRPFGEDHDKQFVYKEPKVTTLAELTLRLQKLYSRKFGTSEIVHIIQESGKVNTASLDMDHAYIQITHVVPYFTSEELEERKTRFERENKISSFVFEAPFTQDGKIHGDVTKQCMRKTILTTSHWFPYVKKRIPVIDQVQIELTPVEVAIEAMEKKTLDMSAVVKMEPPDLKRLQLLLQGSISTQVNQGVQEYVAFLREPHVTALPQTHAEKLKDVYRSFMKVCQEALELNGRLISTDQLLYQDELRSKFQQMQSALSTVLPIEEMPMRSSPSPTDTFPGARRPVTRVDPHRMSAILFHSISGSK